MTKSIEFLFDFGSPYTYLAYHALPRIALAREAVIEWTPVLLGGIFQATGNHSPATIPLKAQHSQVDLQRWARAFNVTFRMNPAFPINTLTLMRGAVAMQARGEQDFQRYLAAIFCAMFEKPRDLSHPDELTRVLAENGFDAAQVLKELAEPTVKERLKSNTERAVARGAFGVPTFFVGDQMFWGQDRLNFVEQALA